MDMTSNKIRKMAHFNRPCVRHGL